MTKKTFIIMLLVLLLAACAQRDPYRVGLLHIGASEMFPNDGKIRALALAASHGDIKKIDQLVADGINVNAVGGRGFPAAYWVLYHPNQEGLKRLLEHGANPNRFLRFAFGKERRVYSTSLMHAAASSSKYFGVGCLKLILDVGNGNPNLSLPESGTRPIEGAVSCGMEESFSLLYNAGAEIDYASRYTSPLLESLYAENYELALFLLQQGVDSKRKDRNGHSPSYFLEIALKYRASEIRHNQWFWRCIDFYEKEGVPIEIQPNIERPKELDSTPPRILKLINKR